MESLGRLVSDSVDSSPIISGWHWLLQALVAQLIQATASAYGSATLHSFHEGASAIFVACLHDQVHDQQAMPDVQQEREHLVQADQHIAESQQRLANQIRVIEGMIQNGHNTALAEECLRHLQQDLEQWRTRRARILARRWDQG